MITFAPKNVSDARDEEIVREQFAEMDDLELWETTIELAEMSHDSYFRKLHAAAVAAFAARE